MTFSPDMLKLWQSLSVRWLLSVEWSSSTFTKMSKGHREYFGKDNVHPNNDGAAAIANEIYNKISV